MQFVMDNRFKIVLDQFRLENKLEDLEGEVKVVENLRMRIKFFFLVVQVVKRNSRFWFWSYVIQVLRMQIQEDLGESWIIFVFIE